MKEIWIVLFGVIFVLLIIGIGLSLGLFFIKVWEHINTPSMKIICESMEIKGAKEVNLGDADVTLKVKE